MRTSGLSLARACRPVIDALETREPDGQPSPNADRDDLSPAGLPDDEDGVTFLTALTPGTNVSVQVVNGGTMGGFVDAWIDVNGNGTFGDPVDQILTAVPAPPGVNVYNFFLPATATPGPTYARFRLSNFGNLPPFGGAGDGEVEDYRVTISDIGPAVDWGDAPDTYQTVAASNGPSHPITLPAVVLGQFVDGEANGQPSVNADMDDLTGPTPGDDEDGIVFLNQIIPGGNMQVQVTNGGVGINFISAWMDFNLNGNFLDATDVLVVGAPVNPGVAIFNFPVPPNAVVGPTYVRFRLSTQPVPQPFGPAPNGEVEDYRVLVDEPAEPSDFGDAPDSYQTLLASNGPRHPLVAPIFFGAVVDPELNGQPSPNADLDDLTGVPDDEDGIAYLNPIVPGTNVQVQVTFGGGVVIGVPMSAWMDFNIDGDFLDPGEQIFANQLLSPGPNVLTFAVPANASIGPTYSRWRVSTMGNLAPFGPAPNGEVEDYLVRIDEPAPPLDFGDAPDTYATLLASNGPRHPLILPLVLGALVDPEPDGQPSPNADLDDLAGGPDDEDGITFLTPLVPGGNAVIQAVNGAPFIGVLDAWVDFNGNGTFLDPGEKVVLSVPLNPGPNVLTISVPPTAVFGPSYARFRLSTLGGLAPVGPAADGEVEDYRIHIEEAMDFGDAPSITTFGTRFPTLRAENGPSHSSMPGMPILGNAWDPEFDGAPHPAALGDDLAGIPDDEDGVFYNGAPADVAPLFSGQLNVVTIILGGGPVAGFVNAWLDLNQDGDWDDPGEYVLVGVPLVPGPNTFSVFVPSSNGGQMAARFRVSSVPLLPYFGVAPDGEVEDYLTAVVPDTAPPAVVASAFEYDTRQAVQLAFSEPLNPASVTPLSLGALNLTDGTTALANTALLSAGNTVATWIYNTPGTFVSDGNYRFTLLAGAVADPVGIGNTPFTLQGSSIYYFGGDADRNRAVNIADFAILAANFNLPGTFSQGDFDYTGVVGIADFAILASKFNTVLPGSLPSVGLAPAGTLFGRGGAPVFGSRLIELEVLDQRVELPW